MLSFSFYPRCIHLVFSINYCKFGLYAVIFQFRTTCKFICDRRLFGCMKSLDSSHRCSFFVLAAYRIEASIAESRSGLFLQTTCRRRKNRPLTRALLVLSTNFHHHHRRGHWLLFWKSNSKANKAPPALSCPETTDTLAIFSQLFHITPAEVAETPLITS